MKFLAGLCWYAVIYGWYFLAIGLWVGYTNVRVLDGPTLIFMTVMFLITIPLLGAIAVAIFHATGKKGATEGWTSMDGFARAKAIMRATLEIKINKSGGKPPAG